MRSPCSAHRSTFSLNPLLHCSTCHSPIQGCSFITFASFSLLFNSTDSCRKSTTSLFALINLLLILSTSFFKVSISDNNFVSSSFPSSTSCNNFLFSDFNFAISLCKVLKSASSLLLFTLAFFNSSVRTPFSTLNLFNCFFASSNATFVLNKSSLRRPFSDFKLSLSVVKLSFQPLIYPFLVTVYRSLLSMQSLRILIDPSPPLVFLIHLLNTYS
ncbi:hypothetical protein ALC57_11618 [Trachymyrmex cornetzi]|uniref:Uncharacterized protein n=1 Tax=Trachymyrmex cornetzi TaxID=471704 RepID=A0A195DTC3_9HYME|nr:hypothetical protein ALC57_11618 [Trachymyrmex cornetzi]